MWFLLLVALCLCVYRSNAFHTNVRCPASKLSSRLPSMTYRISHAKSMKLHMTEESKSSSGESLPTESSGDAAASEPPKTLQANPFSANKLKPKDLFKKYGIAYLTTSITFAIFSYAFFYFMVANGVDVASLLESVGISSSAAATKTGTAAIAYALHKAASPIRFPPTVLLTPVVAKMLGKKPKDTDSATPPPQ